tara:strand:- start:294 stop:524 length:231 start_codon:yes stop_codon:yes gene_type:complete
MKKKIDIQIKKILSKNLKVNINLIKDTSKAKDFEQWDSLQNVNIFLSLKKIKKNIDLSDYNKCKKVSDIINLIKKT